MEPNRDSKGMGRAGCHTMPARLAAFQLALLNHPATGQGWLVKATVEEEMASGIVAIRPGDKQWMPTRVQPKVKQTTEVISNICPSNTRQTDM